jgi:hypothetical protein
MVAFGRGTDSSMGDDDEHCPTFDTATGTFRNCETGQFVDGQPDGGFDHSASRFRDDDSGRFEPAPSPVTRRGTRLFD